MLKQKIMITMITLFFLDANECIFLIIALYQHCTFVAIIILWRSYRPVPSSKFCRVNCADTTWTEINWKGKLSHFPFHQSTPTTTSLGQGQSIAMHILVVT